MGISNASRNRKNSMYPPCAPMNLNISTLHQNLELSTITIISTHDNQVHHRSLFFYTLYNSLYLVFYSFSFILLFNSMVFCHCFSYPTSRKNSPTISQIGNNKFFSLYQSCYTADATAYTLENYGNIYKTVVQDRKEIAT